MILARRHIKKPVTYPSKNSAKVAFSGEMYNIPAKLAFPIFIVSPAVKFDGWGNGHFRL